MSVGLQALNMLAFDPFKLQTRASGSVRTPDR
jgi:hypothetical protein